MLLKCRSIVFLTCALPWMTYAFIPQSCSFPAPEGCKCIFIRGPKVTCKPDVKLISFPEVNSSMSGIDTLDLSDNNIISVNSPVCQDCLSLRRLILSYNRMREISGTALDELVWPRTLEYLDLSYNDISEMSQIRFLRYFPELEVLKLNNNQLSFYQLTTAEILPKLRELYLANNQLLYFRILCPTLTTLTFTFQPYNSEFAKLSVLKADSISSIHFVDTMTIALQMEWEPTESLKYLGFENAELRDSSLADVKLPPDSNTLRILSLKDNRLTLHLSYFNHFAKRIKGVKYLDLGFNRIQRIGRLTFKELENLEQLILNDNNIEYIDFEFLNNLMHLKKLDLRNNEIHSTEHLSNALENLPHLHSLFIGNNPFNCLCSSDDMKKMILRQRNGDFHILDALEIRHSIRCARPPDLAGQLVASLNITTCIENFRN